jgi:sarcosine oxidase, subunit alpha
MSGHRLLQGGAALDRSRPLSFRFNGRTYQGFAGDTLASALVAQNVSLFGRSFKYHRPRGLIGVRESETNALVSLGADGEYGTNIPATQIALYEGLVARSVNCWPSPQFDLAAINNRFTRLLGAGFYYKTFMWPSWHLFEGFIRKAAGLGHVSPTVGNQIYDVRHLFTDHLIIGAGQAGRSEAEAAASKGANIMLVDKAAVAPLAGVSSLPHTMIIAQLDHGLLLGIETIVDPDCKTPQRQRLIKIRCNMVTHATGCYERPLVFAGNDKPGIMLVSAAKSLLDLHAVIPGRQIVIAANNNSGQALADAYQKAGVDHVTLLPSDAQLVRAYGGRRITAIEVIHDNGRREKIACDTLLMSGGFSPAAQLFVQAGGRLETDGAGLFKPGQRTVNTCFVSPIETAVQQAISDAVFADRKLWKESFIDFSTDVTLADIALAVHENYRAPNHLKRYTTLGMGTDQGRLSAANGAEALARLEGVPLPDALPTKARPPLVPVAMGLIAAAHPGGELWRPRRTMPAHQAHLTRGGVISDYIWERPSHYPVGDEDLHSAAQREALAVRTNVGLFDGSPLGKVEIKGPEAAAFLDHIYVGTMSSLAPGRIRYGLMLNENGSIIDDGVCIRLAEDHFLLNTSSGRADRIFAMLEEAHQCDWPYDLVMQNVQSRWATFAVAGPKARSVLMRLHGTIDLSAEAFPHLHYRTGELAGFPVRIARVSFSGELSYEISVAADQGDQMWQTLLQEGQPEGLTPYGIEALEILRTEKGYIHVGVDTDSETTPADIGFGAAIAKKKSDFLGRRSLLRPAMAEGPRKQLIGFTPVGYAHLPAGAHVVGALGCSDGFVTSSYHSSVLNRCVAIGLLVDGRARIGERVHLYSEGKRYGAVVTGPIAFDPAGDNLNV